MSSRYDIEIDQGASYSLNVLSINDALGVPFNLTGYIIRGQLRASPALIDPPLATFTITAVNLALGAFTASLTPAVTAAFPSPVAPSDYFAASYDIEVESPGGVVTRVLRGLARIIPEVTR
jgi:hypothetical protein